jgi:hypothetical protein
MGGLTCELVSVSGHVPDVSGFLYPQMVPPVMGALSRSCRDADAETPRPWTSKPLALVPNRVVDGVRAPIVRLLVSKPQSKKGPSWPILVPA